MPTDRGDVSRADIQRRLPQIYAFIYPAKNISKQYERWMLCFCVEFAPSLRPNLLNNSKGTSPGGVMWKKILDFNNKAIFLFATCATIKLR